jgi:hypothetical protein
MVGYRWRCHGANFRSAPASHDIEMFGGRLHVQYGNGHRNTWRRTPVSFPHGHTMHDNDYGTFDSLSHYVMDVLHACDLVRVKVTCTVERHQTTTYYLAGSETSKCRHKLQPKCVEACVQGDCPSPLGFPWFSSICMALGSRALAYQRSWTSES